MRLKHLCLLRQTDWCSLRLKLRLVETDSSRLTDAEALALTETDWLKPMTLNTHYLMNGLATLNKPCETDSLVETGEMANDAEALALTETDWLKLQ